MFVKAEAAIQAVHPQTQQQKQPKQPQQSSVSSFTLFSSRFFRFVLRLTVLDLPVLLILLTYASLAWLGHVHEHYLVPQLEALVFTDERSTTEHTYYNRYCTVADMTTDSGADLFLDAAATAEEAYQHQLRHGFTVFRNVLSETVATNLRTYVANYNRQMKEEESIFVIENENRYSFGLGTEQPAVVAAMKEVASSPALKPALEQILGPDPALIEMTAITASAGAVAQYWHDDVIAPASAMDFGRTFGPSYSVFVQLQNTTAAMGATAACPGTHYCSDGPIDEFCEAAGFQLTDSTGYWNMGDALLMNMNSYHRGAAHIDETAADRVMLILTFVPRPVTRAESRQMSQGITFSLRWDMWGHTLQDLAAADTSMNQPWATLRAAGLYKPAAAAWGIDYVTGASMRMANGDHGFRPDQLEEWIDRGGFKYLPAFLEGQVDMEEGDLWYEYLSRTHANCLEFAQQVVGAAVVGYLTIFLVGSVLLPMTKRKSRFLFLFYALLRLTGMGLMTAGLFFAARARVDRSGWAKDIVAGRRYASTVDYERRHFAQDYAWAEQQDDSLPSTFPTRHDVLIETRYGSEQLAMYNDFINGHPANRWLSDRVRQMAPQYRKDDSNNNMFQQAAAEFIVESMAVNYASRFLLQNPDGHWLWIGYQQAVKYTREQLTTHSSKVLKKMRQELRFLKSNHKYGIFRDSALGYAHTSPFLQRLEERLLSQNKNNEKEETTKTKVATTNERQTPPPKPVHIKFYHSAFALSFPKSMARQWEEQQGGHRTKKVTLQRAPELDEPFDGAWLAAGDMVEAYEDHYWYLGQVLSVNAHGQYVVMYPDGGEEIMDSYSVRHWEPFTAKEPVEVFLEDDEEFVEGTIVKVRNRDMTDDEEGYVLRLDDSGELLDNLTEYQLRRRGERVRTKHVYDSSY